MLRNRNFRIILSLVIAVLLWIYVVGAVDPTTVKQIRNVPISMVHTLELEERGLAVSEMGFETVDIRVSGPRATLNELEPSDITARIDLASATKGENELAIKVVGVLNGIDVREVSETSVAVTVDDLVTKTVNVDVEYQGEFNSGESGYTVEVSPLHVEISGAESRVSSISKALVVINSSDLVEIPKDIQGDIIPVNSERLEVQGVNVAQSKAIVKSVLSITKKVPLNVKVVDESSDNLIRTCEISEEIVLEGRSDNLSKLTRVEAEDIVVTELKEESEVPISLVLPEGVKTREGENLIAKVSISEATTKEIAFLPKEVEFHGGTEGMSYSLSDDTELKVTLKDSSETLNSIEKGDVKLIIDVAQLTLGTWQAEVQVSSNKDVKSIVCNPETVNVIVTGVEG